MFWVSVSVMTSTNDQKSTSAIVLLCPTLCFFRGGGSNMALTSQTFSFATESNIWERPLITRVRMFPLQMCTFSSRIFPVLETQNVLLAYSTWTFKKQHSHLKQRQIQACYWTPKWAGTFCLHTYCMETDLFYSMIPSEGGRRPRGGTMCRFGTFCFKLSSDIQFLLNLLGCKNIRIPTVYSLIRHICLYFRI